MVWGCRDLLGQHSTCWRGNPSWERPSWTVTQLLSGRARPGAQIPVQNSFSAAPQLLLYSIEVLEFYSFKCKCFVCFFSRTFFFFFGLILLTRVCCIEPMSADMEVLKSSTSSKALLFSLCFSLRRGTHASFLPYSLNWRRQYMRLDWLVLPDDTVVRMRLVKSV